MSDTEILSDDDVAVVVNQIIDLDKIENDKSKSKQIETIVIDDERNSQSDNNNVTNGGNNITLDMNIIYTENKLLAEFIEKCINLEHTGAMIRIINRTLLRVYKETDKNYKNSSEFEKILQKHINLIEIEPHKKYSHMKNIIEALKSGGIKKRVKLTTLATNLKNKQNKRFVDFGERKAKRPKRHEIIDLDMETNDLMPVINLDEDPNDVIVLDEPAITRVDEEKENMQNSIVNHGAENKIDDHEQKNSQNGLEAFAPNNLKKHVMITEPVGRYQNDVIALDGPTRTLNDNEANMHTSSIYHGNSKEIDDNHHDNDYEISNSQNDSEESSYLTPQIEVFVPNNITEQSVVTDPEEQYMDHNGQMDGPINVESSSEDEEQGGFKQEIKKIECKIQKLKQIIKQLDETEVISDNLSSPYILSEKVKSRIVALYKTLCELTGSESVKKRTVRLQVQDGHPAGPVRRLEEFINTNTGEDGEPQFPDFRDVTMCVLQANEADALRWSKAQILKEASALFTQCGRALQKRRQKREWRDLLATVRTETLEYDPADGDPILQAKLEQNRRIALCKEHELLNRYSKMQDMSAQAKLLNRMNPSNSVTQNGIRIINSCENINVRNEANVMEVPLLNIEYDKHFATNTENEAMDSNDVLNKTQNSLVIIKTEVAVEFEPPGNDVIPEKSNELLNVDVKNTNYIPCSQRIRIEEDNITENNESESNAKIKTDIDMQAQSIKNNIASVDNTNEPNCELAASSQNNHNKLDSVNITNSNRTVNTNGENSQEDISNKRNKEDLRNGAGDSLVNEETNGLGTVKIEKEPVDIAALLDSLGDNFSADIVDIEDPFLVIEISDSSDDEAL